MEKVTIICDCCEKEIESSSWESFGPIKMSVWNSCQNPLYSLEGVEGGYQTAMIDWEHVCYSCNKFLAMKLKSFINLRREMTDEP